MNRGPLTLRCWDCGAQLDAEAWDRRQGAVHLDCGGKLEPLTAYVGDLERLRWGVVANAGRLSADRRARWSHVADATGLGSTSARELCEAAGFDPDEMVGGGS